MKFFDYVNTFGMDLIIRGKMFPSYLIDYQESYEEPKQFVHIFMWKMKEILKNMK